MMKVSFENNTALGLIEDMRAFLAQVDGDGADDAAEAATGGTGGSTRKKRETKAEKEARLAAEAAATAQAATGAPQPTFTPPGVQGTVQQQPAAAAAGFGQGGAAPGGAFAAPANGGGFPAPGVNAAPQLHTIAKAIIDVIDKSIAGGQPTENVVTFFKPYCGPDAANATLDQLKQVFIPRLSEETLRQIAPQLSIPV